MKNHLKYILIYLVIFLSSCSKNEVSPETKSLNAESVIISKIKHAVSIRKQSLTKSNSNNFTTYTTNPFDYVGESHNDGLNYILSNNYYDSNEEINTNLADYFEETPIDDIDNLANYMSGYSSSVMDNNGNYVSDFVDSLPISNNEKDYLNTYYDILTETETAYDRVELSKVIEDLVIEDEYLTQIERDRLLKCFAIYRYSVSFWDDYGSGTTLADRQVNIWDSFGEFLAQHGWGDPQDGAGIQFLGTLFSALMALSFGLW